MNIRYMAALAAIVAVTSVSAQTRGKNYPKVLSDHSVEFRVSAPQASCVQLDFGKMYEMSRNEDGVWSCVTEPKGPGFHYYSLIVDGLRVADPNAETFYGCGFMSSGVEIPYGEGDDRFYVKNVPHGAVSQNRYYSETAGSWRRMFVYTPADYNTSDRQYPVLYILHGGGEDERGWAEQGRTDIILDNLIAEGKAAGMVVAMIDGNSEDIESEILGDIIPFVEKSYRVKGDAGSRALAGLSMGGLQTLSVVIRHPELFSHVGVFSSGWFDPSTPMGRDGMGGGSEKYYEMIGRDLNTYRNAWKTFYITSGCSEDAAQPNARRVCSNFDRLGIRYEYFETPGGHTWPVWRESLYRFAQKIFR